MEELVFGRRYRAIEKIGTGGMADVYKAVDEVLGRTVAVKVMHPRYASDQSFATRFRQEAQAAANLQSPNIVNMYDWGADGDTYYMVMEYVRGTDLKAIIQQKGYLSSAKVADIGAQVCAALTVAHGYDIIHRDIKPHNIMVQPDGSVKVMDFGIARAGNTTMTQTGSVLGTAHYVSPEQAQGKELHATSDLYSLGVVLYEASTGQVPFDADTPVAVALKQVNEQPKPPRAVNPNVDPSLEAVITKAMQKNPASRYQSAEEMRKDLQAVAQGRVPAGVEMAAVAGGAGANGGSAMADRTAVLPTVGQPNGGIPPRRSPEPRKRQVWPWLLVVLALVLAGFGVAWALGVGPFAPARVQVPDLTGMTQAEATLSLTSHGLTASAPTQAYSDSVETSRIVTQTPSPGQTVDKGSSVAFVLSKGPAPVAVPKVVGLKDSDAIATLKARGFTPIPGLPQSSLKVPTGIVISQEPTAGTEAPRGSQVTYVVSTGPPLNAVPDVSNRSRSSATSTLRKAGFKVSTNYDFSASVPAGDVISQNPPSGGSYPPGSTVSILVSQGPGVNVPDVSSLTSLQQAIDAIKNVGLSPSPSTEASSGAVVTISGTTPAAGTTVEKGSTVTIHFSM